MNKQTIINLESLIGLSASLNETFDTEIILNSALLSLMGKLKIFRAAVFLKTNDESFRLILKKGRIIFPNEGNSYDYKCVPGDKCTEFLKKAGLKYIFNVAYQNKTIAFISLGDKIDSQILTEEEDRYANLVATITANALQNAFNKKSLVEEKNKVEKRHQIITTLFEMAREFSSLLTKDDILRMLSFRLMGQLMVSRFAIYLKKNDASWGEISNRFNNKNLSEIVDKLPEITQTTDIKAINSSDKALKSLAELDIVIISPMIVQGNVKGLLLIGRKMSGEPFSPEDLKFIEALGNISISSIENERLFKEEVEKKRLESELSLALEIQRNLLPSQLPTFKGLDIFGNSFPSRHVGGDYFDIIELKSTEILVAIADVSGKGMPASLLMANVQASLRIMANTHNSLRSMVRQINKIVFQNTSADKFVTFFAMIINTEENSLTYINAGHNPPYILRQNKFIELNEGGLILGFMDENVDWDTGKVKIMPGDLIFLYTDGITEAMNSENEEFGEENLKLFLSKYQINSSEIIISGIKDEINSFAKGLNQYDDITAVAVKVK